MQTHLKSEFLQIVINDFGAELCSVKNSEGLEFMWQANKDVWPRHAPVLFPIVGKLKDNLYKLNNKHYSLTQHGFARDSVFELIEHSHSSCIFQLNSSNESRKLFPYDFTFQIRYELNKNTLTTHYKVINPSGETLLFSVGAHPGFNCPLLPNESFKDYYLLFENNDLQITELNNGLLCGPGKKLELTDNRLSLSKNTFDNDALVFENSQINKISLLSKKSAHKISLDCKNWPYFGIWSKKECTDFICLEPWYGIADKEDSTQLFPEKAGLIQLEAKKEFSCSFSVTFE